MQISHVTVLENVYLLTSIPLTSKKSDKMSLSPHQPARLRPTSGIPMDYSKFLDVFLTQHTHSKGLLLNKVPLDSAGYEDHKTCIHLILAILDTSYAKKSN